MLTHNMSISSGVALPSTKRKKETNEIKRTTKAYNQRKESEEHTFTYAVKNINRLDAP